HIAEINANTKGDVPVGSETFVCDPHSFLQRNRALHGMNSACELYQNAVAHHLDDPAVVFLQQRVENVAPALLEGSHGAGLILLDQSCVTYDVGGKDRG